MEKLLSTRRILFIPLFLVIIVIANIFMNYQDAQKSMYVFLQKQAQNINTFMMSHRNYYQNLYINKIIPLTEETLKGLPAFSSHDISKEFSQKNFLGISIQTVSNKARNEKNQASLSELEAIEYFKKNRNQKEYFEDKDSFFQYATPLFIEKKCLSCHGKKEDAPKFIQDKYSEAYNYKLGDLRGIVSIQIPKVEVSKYFNSLFIKNVFFDLLIISTVLFVAAYLIKYFRGLSDKLEKKIREKTKELRKNLAYFESHKVAMDESQIVTKSDLNGTVTYANKNFEKISGYSAEESIGQQHSLIRHEDTDIKTFEDLWKTIQAGDIWKGILKNKKKSGEAYWVSAVVLPIKNEHGQNVEYIGLRHDITEVYKQRETLEKIAYTDSLTGLGNRNKLNQDIKRSVTPSLAIMNADYFNQINNFYGYEIGDIVIKEVAKRLEILLHKKDKVYHLQGDEFAILSDNSDNDAFVDKIIYISTKLSKEPIVVGEEHISINFSTSISFELKENLLVTANMALRNAKNGQKDLVIYSKKVSLSDEYENNIKWTKRLRYALENDLIVPFFQPISNNKTGDWNRYEALVRIVDGDEVITPHYFLDIAKKTKLYTQITKVMIRKTFEYFKDKLEEFSINITIEDITNQEIKRYIFETLEKSDIGSQVIFEIVESESIHNFDSVLKFIRNIKRYGCRVAIDDFGTGYSNFEHILKLKADYLKIDGSLIKDIHKDQEKFVLVSSIVSFAKQIGMKTTAEFVESEEIEQIVKKLGVDYSQGYYYSEPKKNIK